MREFEGAIGYDCRRLEDGRRALFRHTYVHKRTKRDVIERRDAICMLQASLMSSAGISSHYRIDVDLAFDVISDIRSKLFYLTFPYDGYRATPHKSDEYDEYFDELDRLDALRKEQKAAADGGPDVGVEGQK